MMKTFQTRCYVAELLYTAQISLPRAKLGMMWRIPLMLQDNEFQCSTSRLSSPLFSFSFIVPVTVQQAREAFQEGDVITGFAVNELKGEFKKLKNRTEHVIGVMEDG